MEFIDIYNDLGQKSDIIIEKNEAHKKALIHKGVCVWIINSNNEILLQTRSSSVMFPNMLDISLSNLAKILGKKDHTTIIHGINKIEEELSTNEELKNKIEIIKKKINP